ncbi:MAG: hypothetical protein NZT92_17350, partial [Abditibacteriales bacterium]|nr:hypothetical protein [Abditibacteriales bacterium]MDW8367618.1 hypothetical protein [Abditibacteriales bacterium]
VTVKGSIGQSINPTAVPVVLRDPVDDSFARDIMGRGDIADVEAAANDTSLYLCINLDKDASGQMVYDVALHGIGMQRGRVHIAKYTVRLQPPDRVKVLNVNGIESVEIPADLHFKAHGRSLRLEVPRSLLGNARVVLLAVSSTFHGLTVDKTAYKVLRLSK